MGDLPSTGRLTVYMSDSHQLQASALQEFIDGVASEKIKLRLDRTFTLDEMVEAHEYMESNQAKGKLVVVN